MAQTKGSYARATEVTRDEIRERRGQSHERWTARRVGIGCDEFWRARDFSTPATLPGSWRFDERDYVRRWVSKPQPPPSAIPRPASENILVAIRRQVRERMEAEALERAWQEEWHRDMQEIERERALAARRAAGLIRVRKNRRDASQANLA